MHEISFGMLGMSDKGVGGGIARTEDLDIVGIIDISQLVQPEFIGTELPPSDAGAVLARLVFHDTNSIDVFTKQLNRVKELMVEEKAFYEGEAHFPISEGEIGENE